MLISMSCISQVAARVFYGESIFLMNSSSVDSLIEGSLLAAAASRLLNVGAL